jgi:hypothetical protein
MDADFDNDDVSDPDWIHNVPEGGRLIATVWECDDDCGCTQAQITHRAPNPDDLRWWKITTLWRGKYHIDGWGDEVTAEDDLEAEKRRVEQANPELYKRIWGD